MVESLSCTTTLLVRHIDKALLGKEDHSLFFMDWQSIMVT